MASEDGERRPRERNFDSFKVLKAHAALVIECLASATLQQLGRTSRGRALTRGVSRSVLVSSKRKTKMVPIVGIELTTYRLQGGCSTTELNRRIRYFT